MWLRVLAFVLAGVECILLFLPKEYEEKTSLARNSWRTFIVPFKHKKFMATMGVIFLWHFGGNLTASALDVHLLETVQMPYSYITTMNASYIIFLLVSTPLWKKMLNKISWLKTFALAVILHAPFSALMGIVRPDNYTWMYPIVRGVQILLYVGIAITLANMHYISLPVEDQTSCLSLFYLIMNMAGFLGQGTGTALVSAFRDFSFTVGGASYNIVTVLLSMQGVSFLVLGLYTLWLDRYLKRR